VPSLQSEVKMKVLSLDLKKKMGEAHHYHPATNKKFLLLKRLNMLIYFKRSFSGFFNKIFV
jgi:hypothetical protein